MTRQRDIDRFVASLAEAETPDDRSVNIYRNATRRDNLKRWLSKFNDEPGSAIFVGAEPGRDGAAITGVPYVSPHVMTAGGDPWGEFGIERGYVVPTCKKTHQLEKTATRYWGLVAPQLKGLPRPLIWNTYPFWPYDFNESGGLKNRGADRVEIEYGKRWLTWILKIFPCARVVASGKQSKKVLKSLGLDPLVMPHPAARISNADLISASKDVAKVLHLDAKPK